MHKEGWRYISYGGLDNYVEEFGCLCCVKPISWDLCHEWWHQYCLVSLWYSVEELFLGACVCEECVPYIPIYRMLGGTCFDYSIGHVEDGASERIQEIIFLGGNLMCNVAAVCGEIMKCFMKDWCEMWKLIQSQYDMIFSVILMCW